MPLATRQFSLILIVGPGGGLLTVPNPTREPFLAYLLVHATMVRRRRAAALGGAERLGEHARALELLADLLRACLKTTSACCSLVVSGGQFAPAPASEHPLTQFAGASREACDTFLTNL